MKALVLAGGTGSRLRPFTYSMPKQLIPIANKPLLQHVIENIRDLGVAEIGVIVGDWEPRIVAAIGDGSRYGVRITYIRQDRPLGLAHCVKIARPFLGDDDFVMYLGDNFLPDGIDGLAGRFRADRPAAFVAARRVPDPRPFGVIELAEDGTVVRLVEKPPRPNSDLAVLGVYFFTASIHAAVEAIEPSARGELEITDAIQHLLTSGADVRAGVYDGYWSDVGRTEDVVACNRHTLAGLRSRVERGLAGSGGGRVDAASRLIGDVVLGQGARVVRSRIEGPVLVGPGTIIEDSLIGPYTAIGGNSLLQAVEISESVVLDRTSLNRFAGVHGSLIGTIAPGTEERAA